MKKVLLPVLGFLMLIGFNSCESETKTTDVNLHFKAFFDGAPLRMYEADYDYMEGMRMRFQLFQFYVSDVALLKADGTEHLLDVELVTFKDVQTVEQADEGVSFLIENIPIGDYQGIRMVIGLTPELNATQPSNYVAGHPLSDHYWSWALGYVFTKIEGNADLNGDGNFDEKLTYHIGHNDLAREKTFSGNITLEQGRAADVYFEVDALDVIRNQNNFIDFRTTPQDHTNDMDLARFISDNLFNALIMK